MEWMQRLVGGVGGVWRRCLQKPAVANVEEGRCDVGGDRGGRWCRCGGSGLCRIFHKRESTGGAAPPAPAPRTAAARWHHAATTATSDDSTWLTAFHSISQPANQERNSRLTRDTPFDAGRFDAGSCEEGGIDAKMMLRAQSPSSAAPGMDPPNQPPQASAGRKRKAEAHKDNERLSKRLSLLNIGMFYCVRFLLVVAIFLRHRSLPRLPHLP